MMTAPTPGISNNPGLRLVDQLISFLYSLCCIVSIDILLYLFSPFYAIFSRLSRQLFYYLLHFMLFFNISICTTYLSPYVTNISDNQQVQNIYSYTFT
jgi:hypothetical protein